jgi:hypothetical protein
MQRTPELRFSATLGQGPEIELHGNVRISGIFDADITELLPMAQADPSQADPSKPYIVHFRHEVPPRYQGVVTLDISRRAG